jgi:hypothetical protein
MPSDDSGFDHCGSAREGHRAGPRGIRGRLLVSRLTIPIALAALALVAAVPAAVTANDSSSQLDTVIASSRHQLSTADVLGADITDTALGQDQLAALAQDGLVQRPRRAFSFGNQIIIVDAATPLTVFSGLNASGDTVHEILPLARPALVSPRAGFVVPPDSAWVYNRDGDWTDIVRVCDGFGNNCQNSWKRQGFWIIDAAWNQGSYQYFRIYGRQTSSTITDTNYPWARTWLEFDNNGQWGGSPNEFEIPLPEEDYHSSTGATISIGFKTGITFQLGKAPVTVGGSYDTSYVGTISQFYEYWHPIVRAEIARGGVQYCRYDNNYKMTRKVTARVGIRQNEDAQLGGWYILRGMQAGTHDVFGNFNEPSACPGPN